MNYRQFGNAGFEVSEIGFGAWGIGGTPKDAKAYGPTDDEESKRALIKAYDLGITFFDTSPLYGYGHSECLIGKALKNVRDKIVIASKAGFLNFKGDQDFSTFAIRKSVEESLQRLQTDYIDILQLHYPPIELIETDHSVFETLTSLKEEGKIRLIGISMPSPTDALRVLELYPFKSIQANFSLIDQRALDQGLFDICSKKKVGMIGRTPLCFGFLTGHYSADDVYDSSDHRSNWSKKQVECWVNAFQLFSDDLIKNENQSNAQIALRFCLSYSEVSTIIPGMLTEAHVEENAKSSQLGKLDYSILEHFNMIYHNNEFIVRS